jgi:hypothetical protein
MLHAMHRFRVLRALAVAMTVIAAVGCTASSASRGAGGGESAAPRAHASAPAPADSDLAAVMERFYQQVEGGHWRIADGMVSPRFRAAFGENAVRTLYEPLADLDVTLRQTSPRTVVTSLTATDRNDRTRKLRFEELVKLRWDGEDWTIDSIARRATAGRR